jgi:apolipoprotein N-acyltransferase
MMRLVFAALSGVLLVLSFPPFDLDGLAWIALVPLLLALDGVHVPRAASLGSMTGIVFFVGVFAWIWQVPAYNVLDEALLGGYLSLYFVAWTVALTWLRTRTPIAVAALAPALWVAAEYLRSHAGFLALPWMLIGHSQYEHPVLLQITSLTGVFGLSFLIVLVNVGVADLVDAARQRRVGLPGSAGWAAAGLVVSAMYGVTILSRDLPPDRLAVAAVQGNIPQNVKWDAAHRERTLERYAALTREAAREGPAVIVWPETAVPGDVEHDPRLFRPVRDLVVSTGVPLLIGSSEHAKFTRREYGPRSFNSMVLMSPEGRVSDTYRKIRLVPFGEYAPLEAYVAWPDVIASATGNSVAGERRTVFAVAGVPIATTICWENIFPDLVREFVADGARIVVNATNEAWFQDSGAPHQFLAISVFRAAENRVSVLRVANTGISAVIDPYGRIVDRLRGAGGRDVFVAGVLTANLPVTRDVTFYTAYGDVFAIAMLTSSAVVICWAATRRPDPRRARSESRAFPYGKAPVV